MAMRLTEQQKIIIREAGMRHFDVVPHLFGSRLIDEERGGDIDLFIPGEWPVEEAVPKRLRFCAELRHRMDDQKIDVVLGSKSQSSIRDWATRHGEAV